jgi:hypothetical protein
MVKLKLEIINKPIDYNLSFKIKKGILVAFGEIFLKSPRVQRIFKRKLQNNLFFF